MQEITDKQLVQVTGGAFSSSASTGYNTTGNSTSATTTSSATAHGQHGAQTYANARSFTMPGPDGSQYSFSWGFSAGAAV